MNNIDLRARFARQIEKAAQDAANDFLRQLEFYGGYAEDLCESEIEKLLLVAFLASVDERWGDDGETIIHEFGFDAALGGCSAHDDATDRLVELAAQYPIGKYQADLVISDRRFRREGEWLMCPLVVVECDGHDFHERTKEQAAKDRRRDREMQTAGYRVLRFTGSEIFRDPWACAAQIEHFLDRLWEEVKGGRPA